MQISRKYNKLSLEQVTDDRMMKSFLRRKRLQRLRKSLMGKTFVQVKNGLGITHRILWVRQSRFGQKDIRVGIQSSDRSAVRWVSHDTFMSANRRSAFGFQCRRRKQTNDLTHPDRRHVPISSEALPSMPHVAEVRVE